MEADEELKKMFDSYNKNIIAICVFCTIQFVLLISMI